MFEQKIFFENGFENYIRTLGLKTYCYGNATHAFADILLYLSSRGFLPGNNGHAISCEIIMPSFIPAKLYKTIIAYDYQPKFYEIDEYCNFNIDEIDRLINRHTKAIFAIHYFGYPAKIKLLRELADEKGIVLIEDCAHVIYGREIGGRLGTWGDFSIFSSRKMLNLPEGGYLVLNKIFDDFKPSYLKRVNSLYTFSKLVQTRGKHFYLRLTNGNDFLNISRVPQRGFIDYTRINRSPVKKISRLSSFYSNTVDIRKLIEKRLDNYSYIYNGIKDLTFLQPLYNGSLKNWTPYSMPVIVKDGFRDILQIKLRDAGINCGAGWPESPFDYSLKRTYAISRNLIEFPVHHLITKKQLDKIIDECKNFGRCILKENNNGKNTKSVKLLNQVAGYSNNGNGENDEIPAHAKYNNGADPVKIKIKIIRTEKEFDLIKNEWEELCQNSESHIFQTYQWQRLWWKYYGEENELNIILFYTTDFGDRKLLGIAPLFIDVKYIIGIKLLSRLRLIGSGVERNKAKDHVSEYGASDYLDFIIRSGYEKIVIEKITKYFKENYTIYDVIQMDDICSDSIIFKYLLRELKASEWNYKISGKDICPRIIVPDSINNYFSQLSAKVRYRLKKIRKDSRNNSLFIIEKVKTKSELEKSFDDFVRLHQKRWNHIGLAGLFSDQKFRNFLEEVSAAFLQSGYLYFTSAYSTDGCIAVECAFKYKNIYYDYLKAFDNESPLSKYRPGRALLLQLIEDAIENNIEVVDLLRGGESYKFEIAKDSRWTYKIRINNPVNGFSLKYLLYLIIRSGTQIKRRVVNERNVFKAHLKNYGLTGIVSHYIPSVIKKIKLKLITSYNSQKLYQPVVNNGNNKSTNEKKSVNKLTHLIRRELKLN